MDLTLTLTQLSIYLSIACAMRSMLPLRAASLGASFSTPVVAGEGPESHLLAYSRTTHYVRACDGDVARPRELPGPAVRVRAGYTRVADAPGRAEVEFSGVR
eukprot:scaffold8620_cov62-Phaeocystis_antarctica.AAC.9